MNRKHFLWLGIVLFISVQLSLAQTKEFQTREQTWFGYFNQTRFTKRSGMWVDLHLRLTNNFVEQVKTSTVYDRICKSRRVFCFFASSLTFFATIGISYFQIIAGLILGGSTYCRKPDAKTACCQNDDYCWYCYHFGKHQINF